MQLGLRLARRPLRSAPKSAVAVPEKCRQKEAAKILHRVRPVVVGIAALAAALFSLPTGAVPDWAARPGTIWHALSQPNGARVYLDAVVVGKIEARQNPPYFVIREFFDKNARIIVYAPPPRELRLGQTVDVEGTLSTLPTGDRALVSVVVLAYLDSQGNLLYHGPLLKGPFKPTPWRSGRRLLPPGP